MVVILLKGPKMPFFGNLQKHVPTVFQMPMYGVIYTALSPSITNMSKQNNDNMSSFFKLQFCDCVVFGVPRFLGCIHL